MRYYSVSSFFFCYLRFSLHISFCCCSATINFKSLIWCSLVVLRIIYSVVPQQESYSNVATQQDQWNMIFVVQVPHHKCVVFMMLESGHGNLVRVIMDTSDTLLIEWPGNWIAERCSTSRSDRNGENVTHGSNCKRHKERTGFSW